MQLGMSPAQVDASAAATLASVERWSGIMAAATLCRAPIAVCVDPQRVVPCFDAVSHWLREALERGDLGRFADIEQDVLSGRSLLWLVWNGSTIEGAAVTHLEGTEKSKVCVIQACGGENVRRWIHLIEDLEDYARAEGCDCVRILGRWGWHRLLPAYRAAKVVLERKLHGQL